MASIETVDRTKGDWRKIYPVWLTGRRINGVSDRAECVYLRLHLIVDDFGCYYASPELLKARIAPRRAWNQGQIMSALAELCDAGLVETYESGGEHCLRITDYTSMQTPPNGKRIMRYPQPNKSKGNQSKPKETKANQRNQSKPVLSVSASGTEKPPKPPFGKGGPSSRKRGGPMGADP